MGHGVFKSVEIRQSHAELGTRNDLQSSLSVVWERTALAPASDSFIGVESQEHPAKWPDDSSSFPSEGFDHVGSNVDDFHI